MARLEQVEIFCSYAHADEELRNELFKHVDVLRRLTPGDLKSSSSFSVSFPKGADGAAQPAELSVRIETSDFASSSREKLLCIPPRGDSDVCVFLLTAQRAGPLRVNVELCKDGRRIAGCLVTATGTAAVGFEPAIQASVGLDLLPGASTSMSWYKAAGAAALGLILISGASVLFPRLYGPSAQERPPVGSQPSPVQERRDRVQARPVKPPPAAKQTPQSAAVPDGMRRVRARHSELTSRAATVSSRIRSIRQKLEASGSPLRRDIVETEASMETHLRRADAAISSSNVAEASENLEAAAREIARLEEFLAR